MSAAPRHVPEGELADLVDLLGEPTALALIEGFGGTRVSVPNAPPKPDHALMGALGDAGVARLVAYFGGDILRVPLARQWRLDVYCSRGLTRREMARRLGVTEKTVYSMISRRSAAARQLSLSL